MESSRHLVNSRTRTNRIGISGGLKRGRATGHSLAVARGALAVSRRSAPMSEDMVSLEEPFEHQYAL